MCIIWLLLKLLAKNLIPKYHQKIDIRIRIFGVFYLANRQFTVFQKGKSKYFIFYVELSCLFLVVYCMVVSKTACKKSDTQVSPKNWYPHSHIQRILLSKSTVYSFPERKIKIIYILSRTKQCISSCVLYGCFKNCLQKIWYPSITKKLISAFAYSAYFT